MWKYYDIWDIEDEQRSLFDTIAKVSRLCNVSYNEVMNVLGFGRNVDIKNMMLNHPTNYFSIEYFLCSKLNDLLRSENIPVRIVGKRRRKYEWMRN